MVILQYALPFIVLIGVLVFVHEAGHFIAAKWNGIRADVFALGMGPRVFGWNWKTGLTFGKLPEDIDLEGRTDYRVSALPIGGYVKIAGMIDESMDTSYADHPPEPWEFRSKNTLQKSFVICAGVIMNFILAIIVLSVLNMISGKKVYDTTQVGLLPHSDPAYEAGLREGDRVLSVNGEPIQYFEQIWERINVDEAANDVSMSVERDGRRMTIDIPRTAIPSDPRNGDFIIPNPAGVHVSFANVFPGTPADAAGFKSGDVVLAMDDTPVANAMAFKQYIEANAKRPIDIRFVRGGDTLVSSVKAADNGQIGVQPTVAGPIKTIDYGFFPAIGAGFTTTTNMVGDIFGLVGNLVTGHANLSESVAGPVAIARAAKLSWTLGLQSFLQLMALLSVTLAVMNILPIPALDGGHLAFILIEGVMRREVPLKIRMAVQQVGFFLLLLLMAFVIYNDIVRAS